MSDPNDPFAAFGSDRTVIKPSAGRAGRPVASAEAGAVPAGPAAAGGRPAAAAAAAPGGTAPLALDALMGSSLNPLVGAGAALLAAGPRLRSTPQHANPAGLREALAEGVRKFEAQAREKGLPNEQVIAGRYILCTFLDECAASTPWGGAGVWSAHSLLVQFHNETWGGEKVYQLMSKLAENVEGNRNLLELLYLVLALGFEGRYRVIEGGRGQLDSVRERLSQMLRAQRAGSDKTLSPRWKGETARETRLHEGLPLWVLASLMALLLGGVFIALKLALGARAEASFATLAALDAKAVKVVAAPPPAEPVPPRLAGFLQAEITAGLVEVQDLPDRSIVTIKGDGFFEPGSAVVARGVLPLLGRIAQALKETPGRVLVHGHTDSQPIRSARFPSNWHLSQERADAVRNELLRTVTAERVRAEGRADAEPRADNGTPQGRARNRRVEITLFTPAAGA
ncbi:DotU family type VI secretion system protein [Aquariibacter albus]|uniref:DotU family type VI secretion system protein n=1 Tax=Aquariibacter albus TaxID=2759899 RepID=A0A839HLQ5_9BURK|nr:DotU family type VI secretion system protein [Aquariibacter albus]MBB1163173.1 DotU family type VI secretion system protein [Aquariibacter albus]